MHTGALIAELGALRIHDAEERTHRDRVLAFVSRNEGIWWKRTTLAGHVTASAWIMNAARTHALLLHHAKLNRWVQPGGHIDDSDASPARAAMREAREETGLLDLAPFEEQIFDIDVHPIPARSDEPEHLHYDLRYLFVAADDAVNISAESLGARWMALAQCTDGPFDRSIARMAGKARRLGAGA